MDSFFPAGNNPFREPKAGDAAERADITGAGADFLASIDSFELGPITDLLDDVSSPEAESPFGLGLGISPQCVTRAMSEVSDENDGSESMQTPKKKDTAGQCVPFSPEPLVISQRKPSDNALHPSLQNLAAKMKTDVAEFGADKLTQLHKADNTSHVSSSKVGQVKEKNNKTTNGKCKTKKM